MIIYLLRTLWLLVSSLFKRRRSFFEESVLSDMVLPNDLDFLLHMNNARYFRHFDYGRTDFWLRNGGYKATRKLHNEKTGRVGCPIVLASITTRFRRELNPFQTFRIRTSLLCWDDKAFYMEQRIERNGFVHCIAIIKQAIVGSTPEKLLEALGHKGKVSPPMPQGVKSWVEYDAWSSQHLLSSNGKKGKEQKKNH